MTWVCLNTSALSVKEIQELSAEVDNLKQQLGSLK
jgi:hypothetical protein